MEVSTLVKNKPGRPALTDYQIRPEDQDAIALMKKMGKKNVFSKEIMSQHLDSHWFDPLLRKSKMENIQAFFLQLALPVAANHAVEVLTSEAETEGDKNRKLDLAKETLKAAKILPSNSETVYQFNQQINNFNDPMVKGLIDQHTKTLYDADMFNDEESGGKNGK